MALRVSLPVYSLRTLWAVPTSAAGTDTDFARATGDLGEIRASGPGKGGIAAIEVLRKVRLFRTMDAMRMVEAVGKMHPARPQRLLRWVERFHTWQRA